MIKMKSYNKNALRGEDYSDKEWQADMAKYAGVDIPDELLYTFNGPVYVMNEMHKQNIEGYMKKGMSKDQAELRSADLIQDSYAEYVYTVAMVYGEQY